MSTNADTNGQSFWSSEPDVTDLMNSDRRPPQAADIRRMDWFVDKCRQAKC